MWKRIYSHKIYELAHDGEGHGKDEKEKIYIQTVDLCGKKGDWVEIKRILTGLIVHAVKKNLI